MLAGWIYLYFLLLVVLKNGGGMAPWQGLLWGWATFVGTLLVMGGKGEGQGGQESGVGGRFSAIDLGPPASVLWRRLQTCLALTSVGLALPVLFSWILSHFTDFSWDGMTSRGIMVWNLMHGEGAVRSFPFGHVLSGFLAFLTGSWQGGKGINLTLIWICLCFVISALQSLHFKGWRLWLLSIVTALNPVAIYQLSSFQIDGHIACLLTILIFSLLRFLVSRPWSWDSVTASGLAFLGLAAAKTSGIFYGAIIMGVFVFFLLKKKASLKKIHLRLIFFLGVLVGVGFLLRSCGQHKPLSLEYIKRAVGPGKNYGFGGGASDNEAIQRMNPLQKFATSAFSRTEISATETRIKVPFEVGRRELRVFEELTPDPRAGGFGPWYGTAFLLAGLGCLLMVLGRSWCYEPGWFVFLAAAVSSFGSQVWWARWTPQNWLLLMAMLMTVLAFKRDEADGVRSQRKILGSILDLGGRALGGLACLATVVNIGLVFIYYLVGMVRQERILDRQIRLAAEMQTPVPLHIRVILDGHVRGKSFRASSLWFLDRGIEIQKLRREPPRPRMKLNKTDSRIPLTPDWRLHLKNPKEEEMLRDRGLIED